MRALRVTYAGAPNLVSPTVTASSPVLQSFTVADWQLQ
jgi:hypothetical protein